jgi:hypothetical protein
VRREQESGDGYGEENQDQRAEGEVPHSHLSSLTAAKVYSASNNADGLAELQTTRQVAARRATARP